jgi:hypothetical protein
LKIFNIVLAACSFITLILVLLGVTAHFSDFQGFTVCCKSLHATRPQHADPFCSHGDKYPEEASPAHKIDPARAKSK